MHDDELVYEPELALPRRVAPARARLVLITALVSALAAAGCCVAALIARAPVAVAPLLVVICVGCPLFAAWEVPGALAALRFRRGEKALARLRRRLAELPETEHPLGY